MDDLIKQITPNASDDPFADQQASTSNQEEAIEGEVLDPTSVSTGETSSTTAPTDSMNGNGEFNYLANLQTQINLNIGKIERLKEEMQPVKEMIESYLENDADYMELTKKAKEASSAKGARKKELMSQPNGRSMDEKMNKLKEEQKEAQEMISQLLGEYSKTTGANEFEGADGELRTIVMVAKLVRKTSLNRD